MTRYETACAQANALLTLVGEIDAAGLALPELPAIATLVTHQVGQLVALGPETDDPAFGEAWLGLCRLLNKQVRILDEALGHGFLRHAGEMLEGFDVAAATMEAEVAREALAEGMAGPADPADRVARETALFQELWPAGLLDTFEWRERVRRARLGRYPAGFGELEALLADMAREVPHVLDVSAFLADLHRKRTWEVGYYPVLDVQDALLGAIDRAFRQGATALATTAPKKASTALATGLRSLLAHRARAEALTAIALGDAP